MVEKIQLKENVIHGNESFPFYVYNNDLGYNEHILDYHWHNEIEFIYLSQGKAVFLIDSNPVKLHANEAICINSGEIHSGYSLEHSHCVYNAVVFGVEMLCSSIDDVCYTKYLNPLIKGKCKLPRHIKGDDAFGNAVLNSIRELIGQFSEKRKGYELFIKASLNLIFWNMIMQDRMVYLEKGNKDTSQYEVERFKKVLNYIRENYSRKITIKELSDNVNLSQYHFCRIFKSLTRRTPMDYINYYRVNQASRLLEYDNRKIMDIAMDVGFDSFSYFIETFKKYKKHTPSEYRNMIKKL